MIPQKRLQTLILIVGDLMLFYISLYFALSLRYQEWVTSGVWRTHQLPFFYIHMLWLFLFYIAGVYNIKDFISYKKIAEKMLKTLAVASILAVFIFYLTPAVLITPKTNLLIDVSILAILLIGWRRLFWTVSKKITKIKVAFLGGSKEEIKFANHLTKNPQLGYEPVENLENDDLINFIKKNNIQVVIASRDLIQKEEKAKQLYKILPLGISVVNFENFYENLVEKIPVSIINESWFLENLTEINKKSFETFKRIADILGSIVLGIPTLVALPFIGLVIKAGSRGPVFYKQKRVGKNNKIFEIIKFRTMVKNAEKNGPQWAQEKDSRITWIGKILRKTSVDELPQLWNVLKGEISFIGPRPERPELTEWLEKEIPHYAMRHLAKPGLSGWAQIKYPYGASIEDAKEKLQYDLYYIKNRSTILELAIAAKTLFALIARKVH
ncbi:MAG: sugar transferase [Candidatus Marinimicrobia bacterium]|nr:sugar transferase [Candidatus Neomarinimicrobiota bacterium]